MLGYRRGLKSGEIGFIERHQLAERGPAYLRVIAAELGNPFPQFLLRWR